MRAAKSNSTASTLSSAYSKAKQIANKQVCIVTGASSGLGLATARKLADSGEPKPVDEKRLCVLHNGR